MAFKRIRTAFTLLRHSAQAFSDDNSFKLSASLSYYTIYALGPLLIIIISLAGIFYGKDAVEGKIYDQLNELVGSSAALQIQDIITSASRTHATTTGAIIGVVILVIAATGIFTEMQSSINFIWSVK